MALPPFWTKGREKIHTVRGVRFQSTLVKPTGCKHQPDAYPLVIYFCGMGASGVEGVCMDLDDISRMIARPFVLVAPIRPAGTWWVLDDHRVPWGCLEGSLLTATVDDYVTWISTLAAAAHIDRKSVSIFGTSAGAYAVTEIIAGNADVRLQCVGLCAVHGHGQPDADGLDEKRLRNKAAIKDNWDKYTARLRRHRRTPKTILGIHNKEDTTCEWKYAELVYKALDEARASQRCKPTTIELVTVQVSRKRTNHNYVVDAFKMYLQEVLGTVDPSTRPPDPDPPAPRPSSTAARIPEARQRVRLVPRGGALALDPPAPARPSSTAARIAEARKRPRLPARGSVAEALRRDSIAEGPLPKVARKE